MFRQLFPGTVPKISPKISQCVLPSLSSYSDMELMHQCTICICSPSGAFGAFVSSRKGSVPSAPPVPHSPR